MPEGRNGVERETDPEGCTVAGVRAENDTGPNGWNGTGDMPEVVRQAHTTGGTCHHYKSQQVKEVPEGVGASIDRDSTEGWRRNSNGLKHLVSIVMRKAGAKTDEIPETIPEIEKEKEIGPEGRTVTDEIAENAFGPDGWIGTGDMPEVVRQARTTGSTGQHYKSQEVKDVPEGGGASRDDQPVVMTNYVESDVLGNMNIY